MSQTITYQCDKCKKESTDRNILKLTTIGIGIKTDRMSSYDYEKFSLYDPLRREMDLCSDCLRALGFIHKKESFEDTFPDPPTLEEMIREIIQEEIQNGN